jgi:DtxR family transcriptional regulator, Mn-dependent transcriptional regulator
MTEQLTDSLARYVLAIYELSVDHKVARSKDIAGLVGVSRPSVTGALQKLAQMDLIQYEPYGYVVLTQHGEHEARQLLLKHKATQDFLELALGLPEERARAVAGAIEQSLPADVLCRLVQFNNFYRTNPDKRFQWSPTCRNLCEIMYGMHGPRDCHSDGEITGMTTQLKQVF